jgi:hypothetical protein
MEAILQQELLMQNELMQKNLILILALVVGKMLKVH